MNRSLAEIPQKVVESLRKSPVLTDEEKMELEEKLLSKGKHVSLRSVKIRRKGDEYSGLDIDGMSNGISLVIGEPQTGKTMSFDFLMDFFKGATQKQVDVEVEIEMDGTLKRIQNQEDEGLLSDICDLERYYHFIEQYDQHSSILYPMNRDELDSQDDLSNLMLAIQPGGSNGAERLLLELTRDINKEAWELKERMTRQMKEEKEVEVTLEDLDSFVEAYNEAIKIVNNEKLLSQFLEREEELTRLSKEREALETRISSRKRYRSFLRSESSKFGQGDVHEILLYVLRSLSCSVCGSDFDITSEEMIKAKGRAMCPFCNSPFDWTEMERDAEERASKIATVRDQLFALDDEISKLEGKLRDSDAKIQSLGFPPILSRIEPKLIGKSPECLVKLTAKRDKYIELASAQEKKLSDLRAELEKERDVDIRLEDRLIGVKKTIENAKATVRADEDNLMKEFIELANSNLTAIRGQDDWFLMPEDNRLRITRAIEEDGETRLTERSFMSRSPHLHEGLRLVICLSVSIAIIEIREKLHTSNLSFVVIDSPESLLTGHEVKRLIELLRKVEIPQVLLFTSREDFGEDCTVVARMERNPSIMSRTELQKAKVDRSIQTRLEFWGIRT